MYIPQFLTECKTFSQIKAAIILIRLQKMKEQFLKKQKEKEDEDSQ